MKYTIRVHHKSSGLYTKEVEKITKKTVQEAIKRSYEMKADAKEAREKKSK